MKPIKVSCLKIQLIISGKTPQLSLTAAALQSHFTHGPLRGMLKLQIVWKSNLTEGETMDTWKQRKFYFAELLYQTAAMWR